MTRPDLAELRRLAEAATPGPWRQSGTSTKPHWYVAANERIVHMMPERADHVQQTIDGWNADAAYIAAASPDVILALLDELEAKR